jgi:hypothetical protein
LVRKYVSRVGLTCLGILIGYAIALALPPSGSDPRVKAVDEVRASPAAHAITAEEPANSQPQRPAARPANPTPMPTAAPSRPQPRGDVHTRIVATGDVMLGRMVRVWAEGQGRWSWPFEATQELVSGGDITLINLENPITDPCERDPNNNIFCSPPDSVEGLLYAGVDIANLANNHMNDHGAAGYESTLDALEASDIQPSDETHVVVIDREGITFGFVGFNLVWQNKDTVIWPTEDILAKISQLDKQVDVLIVSFHWGTEFRTYSTFEQREMGHAAIDAGADLIVGTHPHVTEESEEYNGKLILYSLGNYIFDQLFDYNARHGNIAVLEFTNDKLTSYELVRTETTDDLQPRFKYPADVP